MLSLRIPNGHGVKLLGVFVQRNGRFTQADILIVHHADDQLHFYAPRAVVIDRTGAVDEGELVRKRLAEIVEKSHG